MIELKNVTKVFHAGTANERRALDGVNLHLFPVSRKPLDAQA